MEGLGEVWGTCLSVCMGAALEHSRPPPNPSMEMEGSQKDFLYSLVEGIRLDKKAFYGTSVRTFRKRLG